MVVEYGNGVYDIVECKFHNDEFVISKEYAKNLQNKIDMFRKYGLSRKRAEVKLVFLTTYGVKRNVAYNSLNISDSLSLEDIL